VNHLTRLTVLAAGVAGASSAPGPLSQPQRNRHVFIQALLAVSDGQDFGNNLRNYPSPLQPMLRRGRPLLSRSYITRPVRHPEVD
jgi:hypothetical protein